MNDRIANRHVLIDYTNHAGVRSIRQIMPITFWWGSTEWHPEEQWILDAYDSRKDDMRSFAVKDIHSWSPTNTATGRSMSSYAKQLQASMELNARMKNRLLQLYRHPSCPIDVQRVLESIDRDEEPAWLTK